MSRPKGMTREIAEQARHEKLSWLKEIASTNSNECILWPWSRMKTGYIQFYYEDMCRASQVILAFSGKPRPSLKHNALHSCDNPPCCNPNHLRWGTEKENKLDMVKRNRQAKRLGIQNTQAKLTEDEVRFIRETYSLGLATQKQLAEQFGMTQQGISDITCRRNWSHVQ